MYSLLGSCGPRVQSHAQSCSFVLSEDAGCCLNRNQAPLLQKKLFCDFDSGTSTSFGFMPTRTTTRIHSSRPRQFLASIAVPALSTAVPAVCAVSAVAATRWAVVFAVLLRLRLCHHDPFLHSVLPGRGPCRLLCAEFARCPAHDSEHVRNDSGWPSTT